MKHGRVGLASADAGVAPIQIAQLILGDLM